VVNALTRALSDIAANTLFRRTSVASIASPAVSFRTITFEGEALRDVRWVPGSKVQIRIEGFTNRTYTPMSWDPLVGRTTILASLHGRGPGTALLSELSVGDEVQFFGPRGSVDLPKVAGDVVMVGDETSFGLAAAWSDGVGRSARCCFEAHDVAAARAALESVGITDAAVAADDSDEIDQAVLDALARDPSASLVLTGRAQSIRRIRGSIREAELHRRPTIVKAYWDERRAGLD
jgi:NADPH-dependent ferric siderophore reductase